MIMMMIGVPRGLRLEDGSPLTMSAAIKDVLRDGTQVFLLLSKGTTHSLTQEGVEDWCCCCCCCVNHWV
jgi:hypothetical protein